MTKLNTPASVALSGQEKELEFETLKRRIHSKLVDKLESRIDKETLSKWKTEHQEPATGKKAEVKGETITVMPEKSDNPVTFRLNQWAADTYPTAFAHLQAAKDMQKGLKRRTTAP